MADAHPASTFGRQAGCFGLAEQRRPSPTMSMPLSANVIRPPDVCSTGSNVGVTKLSARAFGQSSRTASTNAVGRKRTPRPVPALRRQVLGPKRPCRLPAPERV
ncbi:hypothetical protein I553_8431 [Mycobacterium xenopi 4042]|uniref:Uncharacterized protein n=1 Tax=Mycobacterium xenopi 4042 TaxID=1299334 RepID=X7ZZC4_MYCXE|nr:hypothetical protein I553_8431 [Mycobacterium xenopi 4042]